LIPALLTPAESAKLGSTLFRRLRAAMEVYVA
jgi:hypothetical protein